MSAAPAHITLKATSSAIPLTDAPVGLAHGDTQEDALTQAKTAAQLWIATATEYGDEVPQPKGRRLLFA